MIIHRNACAAALFAALALPEGTLFAQPAASGDIGRGQHLFMADGCYECHGTVGQGGAAGPRLAPSPPPAEAIALYIRHPANVMPPYTAKVVSDQDVRDIAAYLASIPAPPPVRDIPVLKP